MKMTDTMSKAAIWELLAEEAVELAHAAQKMARLLRGENPLAPDMTKDQIFQNVVEEFNDVLIETDILDVRFVPELYEKKLERFTERYKDFEMEDK